MEPALRCIAPTTIPKNLRGKWQRINENAMIDWSDFQKLPGSAESNFEFLCRALIRLHYGKHGQFAALANQPGVEFHLQLRENCALGAAEKWFGWQCRWY